MKHFSATRHAIAASSISTIVISLSLAATSTGQAMTGVMQNSTNGTSFDFKQLFNDAIDTIENARELIENTIDNIQDEDGDVVEAKDVNHVIENLISTGYLKADSPAKSIIMKKDIDVAFSELEDLAATAQLSLTWARDSLEIGDDDSYLGYTAPAQTAVDDMMVFARDLQMVVGATWRDHNGLPSFVTNDQMLTETKPKTAAA